MHSPSKLHPSPNTPPGVLVCGGGHPQPPVAVPALQRLRLLLRSNLAHWEWQLTTAAAVATTPEPSCRLLPHLHPQAPHGGVLGTEGRVLGRKLLPVLSTAPPPQAGGAAHQPAALAQLLPQLEAHPAEHAVVEGSKHVGHQGRGHQAAALQHEGGPCHQALCLLVGGRLQLCHAFNEGLDKRGHHAAGGLVLVPVGLLVLLAAVPVWRYTADKRRTTSPRAAAVCLRCQCP